VSEPAATAPSRPLPDTRNAGKEFWIAAAAGDLLVPHCKACKKNFWYPRPLCPHCGSDQVDWVKSSGKGSIHTFTVVRQSGDPYFKTKVPYAVAMVELAEGPRILTNLVDCDVDALKVGMRVAVCFEAVAGGIAIPLFGPEGSAA
jgi:uncharacterized OB-fold protein